MPQTEHLDQSEALVGPFDHPMPALRSRDLLDGHWAALKAPILASISRFGFLSVRLDDRYRAVQRAILDDMDRFFGSDESVKNQVRDPGGHYGWTPSKSEPAYQPGTVSNVESYDLERPLIDDEADPYWPSMPGFRDNARRCWSSYLALGDAVLAALADTLGLAPNFFRDRCRSRALNTMRLLHYPAEHSQVRPHEVGIAAHTDFECITLLHQTRPGLEIRTKGDGWREAPAGEDQLIVLFDDMLERWTNGEITATGHRVRRTTEARHSIVMFLAVDPGVAVEPLSAFVRRDRPAAYPATEQRNHIAAEMARARALLASA